MATPGNPGRESSINEQRPHVILSGNPVDNPAIEDAVAEQEYISSGESDDDAEKDPADDLNDVTRRRRAQNASFEAL